MAANSAYLNEFDKTEWFDMMRKLRPDVTREEFDKVWSEFQTDKAEHYRKQGLQ